MRRRVLVLPVLGGIFLGILAFPATTRQGVDYQMTVHRLPLAGKAAAFLLRHYEYRRLAAEVTHGFATDELKAVTLMEWVQNHIRPIPPGWPVVDDHVLNIIIRGYGTQDQMADVFTVLSTYAGVPAFWKVVRIQKDQEGVVLSFLKIDGQWTIWDAGKGVAFRDETGRLLGVQELIRHFEAPDTLRAQKQMPGGRIRFEFQRLLKGLSRRFGEVLQ